MATLSQIAEAIFRPRFDDQMSAGAKAAEKAMSDLAAAVEVTDDKVKRGSKSFQSYVNANDDVTKAARRAAQAAKELAAAQKAQADDAAKGIQHGEAGARALAALAQRAKDAEERLRAMQAANAGANQALGLTRQQMQALAPQLADIGVSLAGGMSPLLVLIQQGPQISDAVGGIGTAFRLLLAAATPARVAVLAFGAAVVGSTAVAESQGRALAELSNRLRATRDDYDALAKSTEAAARAAAANSSLSTGEARAAGQTIAGSRNFGGTAQDLQQLIELSGRLATVMGTDASTAAGKLADALNRPSAAAKELVEGGFRGFNESLLRTVERLENQGKVTEASRLVLDAYRKTAETVARTPLQQATEGLAHAFTALWQEIQPGVVWLGEKLANALAVVVEKMTAVVRWTADAVKGLREYFGLAGQAPEAAQPQRSATDLALETARGVGSRFRQRQDANDQITRLQAGLAGASGYDARQITAAIGALREQLQGLEEPTDKMLKGLRDQVTLAKAAEGAEREFAQALIQVREAHGGAATAARAQQLVQDKLTADLDRYSDQTNRATSGVEVQAAAYRGNVAEVGRLLRIMGLTDDAQQALSQTQRGGAAAAAEAADMARALTEAYKYGKEGSEEYAAAVRRLYADFASARRANVALASEQSNADQQRQIDLIRAEAGALGESETVRNRLLAVTREQQRIDQLQAPISEAEKRRRLENAAAIADETVALDRQKDAMSDLRNFGSRAFDRIGEAITQAFVQGRGAVINFGSIAKGIMSELIQLALRLAVINPLSNWAFGTNLGTLSSAGNLGGGLSLSSIGSAFGLGRMLGGDGLMSSIGNSVGLSGIGNSISSALNMPMYSLTVSSGEQAFRMAAGLGANPSVTLGQTIGGVAGLAGGAYGLYSGIQQGGLGGVVTGLGGAASMVGGASMLGALGPGMAALGPYGLIAGAVLGLLGGLLGGAKPSNKTGSTAINLETGESYQFGQTGSKFSQENRDESTRVAQSIYRAASQVEQLVGAQLRGGLVVDVGNRDGLGAQYNGGSGYQFGYNRSYSRDDAGVKQLTADVLRGMIDMAGEGMSQAWRNAMAQINFGDLDNALTKLAQFAQATNGGKLSASQQAARIDYGNWDQAVGDLTWIKDVYDPLQKSTEAASQFQTQLDALAEKWRTAIEQADKLGLASDKLWEARRKEIDALQKQRATIFEGLDANLSGRLKASLGVLDPVVTVLEQFDARAKAEVESTRATIAQWGASQVDQEAWIARLQGVQASERQKLQADAEKQRWSSITGLIDSVILRGYRAAREPGAQLIEYDAGARRETEQYKAQLEALGVAAQDVATEMQRLAGVQAAERQALVEQLTAQRNATLGDMLNDTTLRGLKAANDPSYELVTFDTNAAKEAREYRKQLVDLGVSTADVAREMDRLAGVQQQERKALQEQIAAQQEATKAQQARTAQGLLEQLAIGDLGGLSGQARYFAGMQALSTARRGLEEGSAGALDEYARVAQMVLPVARDFLGTSDRYGALVDVVARTLREFSPTGDPANLAALIDAQTSGTDQITETLVSTAGMTNGILSQIRADISRLNSLIAAVMAKQAA